MHALGTENSEPEVLQTYTMQVVGPYFARQAIWRIPPSVLRETEENLTDLLPEGYSVKIKEWDA